MQLLITDLWSYLPDSKRLELWRAQKEKKSASKPSATKAPWKGGGTPALKQKQTPNTCMSTGRKSVERKSRQCSSSVRKEVQCSEQKERPLSQNRFSSSKKARKGEEEEECMMQSVTEDDHVPVPPTNLSGAFDDDDVHDDNVHDNDNDDEDGIDGGNGNIAAARNSLSRTVMPVMSDDDDDLILNSSLETTEVSPSQTNFTEAVVVATPSSQTRKRKTPDRTCKSALKQVNKVARTEQRSVTFTTPLRCSPRLAKVGEGTSTSTATPKNKINMRYSI